MLMNKSKLIKGDFQNVLISKNEFPIPDNVYIGLPKLLTKSVRTYSMRIGEIVAHIDYHIYSYIGTLCNKDFIKATRIIYNLYLIRMRRNVINHVDKSFKFNLPKF